MLLHVATTILAESYRTVFSNTVFYFNLILAFVSFRRDHHNYRCLRTRNTKTREKNRFAVSP